MSNTIYYIKSVNDVVRYSILGTLYVTVKVHEIPVEHGCFNLEKLYFQKCFKLHWLHWLVHVYWLQYRYAFLLIENARSSRT